MKGVDFLSVSGRESVNQKLTNLLRSSKDLIVRESATKRLEHMMAEEANMKKQLKERKQRSNLRKNNKIRTSLDKADIKEQMK